MTTDADLEDLRTAYEQLRAENTQLRDELARKPHEYKSCFDLDEEVERLRDVIERVEAIVDGAEYECDDTSQLRISSREIRAALRGES